MATYRTPGVYVEEISTLPPSVAEVSTAIPAFLGYTQKGPDVARISTLLEYEELFGKANPSTFTVATKTDATTGLKSLGSITRDDARNRNGFLMHYCMSTYFKNGGGSCYVVSVGNYSATPAKSHFEAGLARLEQEDEPTLILLTDAINLAAADYHDLCQQALAQCEKLGDRFAIFDVKGGDVAAFRNGVGSNYLMYGAAYHPYLQTSQSFQYDDTGVEITGADIDEEPPQPHIWEATFGDTGVVVSFAGSDGAAPEVQLTKGDATKDVDFSLESERRLRVSNVGTRPGTEVAAAWAAWKAAGNDGGGFNITAAGSGSGEVSTTGSSLEDLELKSAPANDADDDATLATIRTTETSLYNQIKTALAAERVVLPPSSAIAGIYASVDRDRGVWKAPANVSVASVIGPVSKVSHEEQERLNVDPTAGKSINAIRAFTGKGTLVWGARTLAGNDNEWRYVSVRRLFIMIEESTKKSTAFAVFEPNDATTWLKVKGMIEAYLYGLWEQGALAGSTPEAAYFVNVGLGKTMTTQDVLEGRMIVEIGVAAVRPAEFIILRFTHKLQEA